MNTLNYTTSGYAKRLRAAMLASDKEPDVERAIRILKDAFEREIALTEKITSMPHFRAWFEGERFDLSKIKARKK